MTPAKDSMVQGGGRPWPITLDNWQDAPLSRWGFAHAEQIVPAAVIRASDPPEPSPSAEGHGLTGLHVPLDDREVPLDNFLSASATDAFLVRDRDGIRYEVYDGEMDRHRRHLLMSVSKSVCSLLIGQLVAEGALELSAPALTYVPELGESAFGTATIQQILDMAADVDYSEDYHDQSSHVRLQDRIAGWRTRLPEDPGTVFDFLTSLRSCGPHGRRFQYCSAATDVLAWVAERVTAGRYPDLLHERLWRHLAMERDAQITIDRAGFAFANGGMSTTARDLSRIGLLLLDHGVAGGRQIVPAGWIEAITRGGDPAAVAGTVFSEVHPRGSYRNHWWVTGDDHGSVYATGIHGQYLWIDPAAQVVIVKFSCLPVATSADWSHRHARVFRRIAETL
ncbi:serine hydrolase domain-containing protein [Streptomyces sp. NPDC013157]|uniref:serine hydrolase domain-containing protein n=1 Tax=Streptomyces sp. NPDC013157 TaxID=3364861 RepID=UPI0036B4E8AC